VQAGVLRKHALLGLIADERAGREDNAKQIWQLLSMELWYRQVRAAGVSAA
jgi:asparagine synthase (glutamine-hydrolysing)